MLSAVLQTIGIPLRLIVMEGFSVASFYPTTCFIPLVSFTLTNICSSVILTHETIKGIRSANQIWLTCEDPRRLVEKYGEYAHRDQRGDHRVVLGKAIVSFVETLGNFHVVARDILKETFLSTVRQQASLAAACQETVILLILGHRDSSSFGIYLGDKVDESNKVAINESEVRRVLPQNASVTLLMTSCFSGGWLVQPKLNSSHLTDIAEAGPSSYSNSSNSSVIRKSVWRSSGSMIASAIVNNMIEVEATEDSDPRFHPTYAHLIDSIYKKANKVNGALGDPNIHFSARNDEWEMN